MKSRAKMEDEISAGRTLNSFSAGDQVFYLSFDDWGHESDYSLAELVNLHDKLMELLRQNRPWDMDAFSTRRDFGHLAETEVGNLLLKIDKACLHCTDEAFAEVGKIVASAVRLGDGEFFRIVARAIGANPLRHFAELTPAEAGKEKVNGRPAKGSDLSVVFPLALIEVTMFRFKNSWCKDSEFLPDRISRNELRRAVERASGLNRPAEISEFTLSRWLTKFEFNQFMKELPIARKPRKNPSL